MREETVRVDDENPPRGGGAGPTCRRRSRAASGRSRLARRPARALRDGRTENGALQIWLTPHGFLKGAAAHAATVRTGTLGGRAAHRRFKAFDRYTIAARLNAQQLVEHVETTVANTLYGDTRLEADYADYRDVAGAKFPMKIVMKQGGFPDAGPDAGVRAAEQRRRAGVSPHRNVRPRRLHPRRRPAPRQGDRSRLLGPRGLHSHELPARVPRPPGADRGAGQRGADRGEARGGEARDPTSRSATSSTRTTTATIPAGCARSSPKAFHPDSPVEQALSTRRSSQPREGRPR